MTNTQIADANPYVLTAYCGIPGWSAISGGFQKPNDVTVNYSRRTADETGWEVEFYNVPVGELAQVQVYVYCVPVPPSVA